MRALQPRVRMQQFRSKRLGFSLFDFLMFLFFSLFLPTSGRGKFAGRSECFYGDQTDDFQDIPPSCSRHAIHTQKRHIHLAQDHRISPSPNFSS